ncbi:MAG: aminodeoxychorismate/anthranilate synthase component II [Deltaproteobacteria bacterium]|nr:aminodeoxychorismate/anthranilate synthase component II [Deltaproteobacteria bacterium]
MIVLIDNYDSFTFNLYQALAALGKEVEVVRNDQLSSETILGWKPSHIVLSPGPKTPHDAGICLEMIQKAAGHFPILGICLGHQAIAQVFGGSIVPAKEIVHGKTSLIFHKGVDLFQNVPNPFEATRYHSLAVDEKKFPPTLKITARSEDGEVMALQHKEWPVFGMQFHPESILTREGPSLLKNFLSL